MPQLQFQHRSPRILPLASGRSGSSNGGPPAGGRCALLWRL